MIEKTSISALFMVLIMSLGTQQIYPQKEMKLMKVNYEVEVNVSPEKAWEVLASYGDVGNYHSGVKSSESINGSSNTAEMGCDRVCYLEDGKRKITVKEKIIDFKNGQYYTYDVYDWENFPLKKMQNTFGVKTTNNKTVIYQTIRYRLKPRILTLPMKGKMKNSAYEALIAYKHYMETGEKNVSMDELKKKYKKV